MKIAGIRETSLYDGKGINFVIFTQGCSHHCQGCQNPQTWDYEGGTEMTLAELKGMIEPYFGFIDGITFSGGDPVFQFNEVLDLAYWANTHGLTVTLYTGYTLDYLRKHYYDLTPFDYIVDGRYDESKRSLDTPFRGSSNQVMYCYKDYAWEAI